VQGENLSLIRVRYNARTTPEECNALTVGCARVQQVRPSQSGRKVTGLGGKENMTLEKCDWCGLIHPNGCFDIKQFRSITDARLCHTCDSASRHIPRGEKLDYLHCLKHETKTERKHHEKP
jgi:hypothetical protein